MNKFGFNNEDIKYIGYALNLSKKNIGLTFSNPAVGSVLVKDNVIISTGITGKEGIPHSESIAILKAGNKAIGSTLYVTLEPCCHFGKTPPCVDLIIKARIARVVIATLDPDNRVNGGGVKRLQEAGIEIKVGVLENDARKLNCGFFSNKIKNRPFITVKLAISKDGKIADKNSNDRWITTKRSRQYAHYLRAKNDAILVGANTIREDNSMLDCRLNGLEKYSPKRIILSRSLNIDLNSNIIQTARQIPTYIVTCNKNIQKFINHGIKIIDNGNSHNIVDSIFELGRMGINNLLIEGGSNVVVQFIENNLIDRLIIIKSSKIIGDAGIAAFGNMDILQVINNLHLKKVRERYIGDDILIESLVTV